MKIIKHFLLMSQVGAMLLLLACKDKNNVENTTWKFCGDSGSFPDILVFESDFLSVKQDTIYYKNKGSAIAVIDRIENYYGERRLFVRDFKNNIGRYCEQ